MSHFARLQGLENDAAQYEMHSEALKKAFNEEFLVVKKDTSPTTATPLHTDSVYYGNNTVTANILPLAFDMVPESYKNDVEKQVIATTSHNAHVSCGVIGMQWLFRQLCDMGRGNLAYLLASQESYPGYGTW